MDYERFDAFLLSLSWRASRRGGLRVFTGGLLARLPLGQVEGDALARKKHRKKKKRCKGATKKCGKTCIPSADCCPVCVAGQSCLSNGSCATVCVDNGDCPDGCFCFTNYEGGTSCYAHVDACPTQTCESTAECPPGALCVACNGPEVCYPLCAAG